MGKIVAVLALMLLCIGAMAGFAALDGRLDLGVHAEPTPAALVTVDQGVVLTPSNIRAIVGPSGDVAVHVSPESAPYQAGTMTDEQGVHHFWVPQSLPASLASLNLEEGQEYVFRRLEACGTCEYDTAAEVLDPKGLEAMAADTNVLRASEPSNMFQLATLNFAKYALDKQAEVAKAGFESNVAIAASGDAATVGATSAVASSQCVMGLAVIAVVGGFIFFLLKSKQ